MLSLARRCGRGVPHAVVRSPDWNQSKDRMAASEIILAPFVIDIADGDALNEVGNLPSILKLRGPFSYRFHQINEIRISYLG